jgi:hypothetical protein
LNLEQLFKISIDFKKYLWQKLKLEKPSSCPKIIQEKLVVPFVSNISTTIVVIDNHMVVI